MDAPVEVSDRASSKFKTLSEACFRYIPLAGSASALGFSVYVMNPKLFQRAFAANEVTVANCLWFNAHVGVGLYIYDRAHIRRAATYQRILYGTFGAVIFNFGSVLLWATAKNVLPKCNYVGTIFGLLSGLSLFIIGKDYLGFVDKSVQSSTMEIAEE